MGSCQWYVYQAFQNISWFNWIDGEKKSEMATSAHVRERLRSIRDLPLHSNVLACGQLRLANLCRDHDLQDARLSGCTVIRADHDVTV